MGSSENLSVVETPACTMICSAVLLALPCSWWTASTLPPTTSRTMSSLQHSTPSSMGRDGEVGLNYGQQETRAGTVTTGSYNVVLPDGRVQTVRYTADPVAGYVAEVTYEGGTGLQPQQHASAAGYPQQQVVG